MRLRHRDLLRQCMPSVADCWHLYVAQMMAALTPTDELMTDASVAQLGTWAPVSEPVSIKPSVDVAVLVRSSCMHDRFCRRALPVHD